MRKPKAGDKLFSLNTNNSARNRKQVLTPVIVSKVGRKYFTTQVIGKENYDYLNVTYNLSDWREKTEYSTNHILYETEQEWLDVDEIKGIAKYVSSLVSYHRWHIRISIEDAKEIKSILDKYDES